MQRVFKQVTTQSGAVVSFYAAELTVDQCLSFPPGSLVVNLRNANNFYDYQYHIVMQDGSIYADQLKNFMLLDGYSWSPYHKIIHYPGWTDADFAKIAEVVESRAQLHVTNKRIRIIDAQYINYAKLETELPLHHGYTPVRVRRNDEWVKVRDVIPVVRMISRLEEKYFQTQQLDLSILRDLLNNEWLTAYSKEDPLFWHSLKQRLEHLSRHPEDAKLFEVRPISEGSWVSGSAYINPLAVVKLVKPSSEDFLNADVVKYIKSGGNVNREVFFPKTITNSQMANSVFGRRWSDERAIHQVSQRPNIK